VLEIEYFRPRGYRIQHYLAIGLVELDQEPREPDIVLEVDYLPKDLDDLFLYLEYNQVVDTVLVSVVVVSVELLLAERSGPSLLLVVLCFLPFLLLEFVECLLFFSRCEIIGAIKQ